MRYLPPQRWADVRPGTVVMDNNGVARAVVTNDPHPRLTGHRMLLIEGIAEPVVARDFMFCAPVELDAADTIGTLFAAGLNPAPIEEK